MNLRTNNKQEVLKQLRNIPGVGPSIAEDLRQLGVRSIQALRTRSPEKLYAAHCVQKGQVVDLCLLYAFRCAVYYASTAKPDPSLLKWWNWKGRDLNNVPKKKKDGNSQSKSCKPTNT